MTLQKAKSSTVTTPEYFILNNMLNMPKDGKIQIDKDREAVRSYFLNEVNPRTMWFHNLEEKLNYLVEEKYIKKELIDSYDKEFIKELFKTAYSFKFRFKTFRGAFKFYDQYALKTNDGKWILERYEDRIVFNAMELANGDESLANSLLLEMMNQRYQPATPTFLNAGRYRSGEKVSCFLLNVEDTMNSIGRSINSALQLSKIGGGVGINLTDIRPSGDPIKGYDGMADGVVPIMKLYEDSFTYANQLGARQGAGVVYLNIFHKDVIAFLSTKKENADEKIRVKTLSLGLVVPDKFYELAAKGKHMYLFSPYDIEKEYGVVMSEFDITENYDDLVSNPRIRKDKINARELENEISKLIQESGYPFIINIDTANKENPVYGKIKMSNLCTEVLQVQKPSVINNDQSHAELGVDVSCNLGSTNVANLMKSEDFGGSVKTMFRALTQVSDSSNIDVVPTVKNANEKYHSVGLGAMNLAGYLAKNKIMYDSDLAIEFTGVYFMLLNYWTLVASNEIARERKQKFYEFEKSEYANGKYFERYMPRVKVYEDLSNEAKQLFEDVEIPTKDDWEQLQKDIEKDGLYTSYRLAVAPTGSIAYINESTASIHPIVQKIEKRSEGKRGDIFYPAPYIDEGALPYYVSAYKIDQRRLIDLYAEAQKHVDQALSMTLFMDSEDGHELYEWKKDSSKRDKTTTRDINILRNYAWAKDIKSIYYVRTFTADKESSSVNECESCSI